MEPFNNDKVNYLLLYVEDDPIPRNFIKKAISLKFPNVKLLIAENGQIGLELFKKHRPDLILTDIQMPVMDGITMATEIRGLDPKVVITVISAYCDTQQYLASAEEIGINHCVTKPVDYDILFGTIEKCIAELKFERH